MVDLVLKAGVTGGVTSCEVGKIEFASIWKHDLAPPDHQALLRGDELVRVGADELAALRNQDVTFRHAVFHVLGDAAQHVTGYVGVDSSLERSVDDCAGSDGVGRRRMCVGDNRTVALTHTVVLSLDGFAAR